MLNLDFDRLFRTPTGRVLISIIWGLGLAMLFKKACEGRNCQVIQYQGPDPKEIEQYYHKYGSGDAGCYQYAAYPTPCEENSDQQGVRSNQERY